MPKSERLLDVLLRLHSGRSFTARDLARELGVSRRTALRYLHELSAAGVPLAARPGPGGGYLVLHDRTLPPLAFTVDEAVSLFFAYQSLQDYGVLPFDAEYGSVLRKLFGHLPPDAKQRIDRMRDRLQFSSRRTDLEAPHLGLLLAAAIDRQVVEILYRARGGPRRRAIQPIGVYAQNGLWYCPAYCFTRQAIRRFRVDRVLEAERAESPPPRPEIAALTLKDYYEHVRADAETTMMEVDLTEAGRRETEHMSGEMVAQGMGWRLRMEIEVSDIPLFARIFLAMGGDARVVAPSAMLDLLRDMLRRQAGIYGA